MTEIQEGSKVARAEAVEWLLVGDCSQYVIDLEARVEALEQQIQAAHEELDAEGVSRSSFGGPLGDIKYEERTINLVGRIRILAARAGRRADVCGKQPQ